MIVERHLILQELTLSSSAEWAPVCSGWLMARVAHGTGYWLPQQNGHRQLNAGDGLVVYGNAGGIVRASGLGPLKLQYYAVQLQYLNGLLTVAEWQHLEASPDCAPPPVSIFAANEPLGKKFMRLADQTCTQRLPMRCALLQLWAGAVADWLPAPAGSAAGGTRLRDQIRESVGQMTEAELAERSVGELASRLHCSARHFSRLFRQEFGVPFHARQIELRLQRARQLLADPDAEIANVASISGYRQLRMFNSVFKKRFGLSPVEWHQQCLNGNFS